MLTKENGLYVWRGRYEDRGIPRAAGFTWNIRRMRWETFDPYTALRSGEDHPDLEQIRARVAASNAQSPKAYEANGLYPYQAAGVEYMAEQFSTGRKGMLLADQPGLGKTAQACRLADEMNWKNLLIVCPASLRLNWVRELNMWRRNGSDPVAVLDGKKMPKPGCTVVVSYNIMIQKHWADLLSLHPFDAMVIDEVHFCKDPKAQRTKVLLGKGGLHEDIKNVLMLSGTPIPNRAPEFYHILKRFEPQAFPWSYWKFVDRYTTSFQGRFGRQFTGSRNEEDLYLRLRGSGFMVRRRKADVLKDLPAKRYQMVVFPPNGAMKKVLKKEEAFDAHEIIENGVPVGSALPEIRKEMGLAKVDVCAGYIEDLLDGGTEKVLVGAHHIEVLDRLRERLAPYGVALVRGDVPPAKRQAEADRFQTDPACRVFLGQLTAAGTGLTLTASSDVVFVEASWVPGDNLQFSDRCHRVGQKGSVLVHYLVVEGSLDAKILGSAARKAEGIGKIMDGG
jgi:SWI/SNF-related matrix-associated actin-dependent regulator 1 of chromatin subfamily A